MSGNMETAQNSYSVVEGEPRGELSKRCGTIKQHLFESSRKDLLTRKWQEMFPVPGELSKRCGTIKKQHLFESSPERFADTEVPGNLSSTGGTFEEMRNYN